MSLVIETGAGNAPLAESYATVAELKAYCTRRGAASLVEDAETSDLESALLLAGEYMAQTYRQRWKGFRNLATQPMDWPRLGVNLPDSASWFYVPQNTIPREVKDAQLMLAWRALKGDDLLADQERAVLSETVGSLSVTYDRNAPQEKRYVAVDRLLSPYLSGTANMMELSR